MADKETIGRPNLELRADSAQLAADLKKAQAAVGAAMTAAERAQAAVNKKIQANIDRINAVKPTASIQLLSQAIEKMGGVSKLSTDQVSRLRREVEGLAAAGAKVPKNLQGIGAVGIGGAGKAAAASLQGSLAAAGPGGAIGAGLTALGPAGLAAAAGIGAIAVGFGAAAKAADDFLQRASKLSDLSAKTGLGTEFLQRLDAAGAQVGVSLEESAGAVFKLEKQIGSAIQGNKEAAQSFKDIGVSLEQLKGKTPEEQFKVVATALGTITDQERFVSAGTEVMGKGFANVAALIRSDFITAMDAAVVVSDEQIKKADDIGDAFTRLGKAGDNLKLQLGSALLGIATGGADGAAAIDTMTRAVTGLAAIISNPAFAAGLRALAGIATLGVSEALISGVKNLAAVGGPGTDSATAEAARAKAIKDTQQQIVTGLAQQSAATRQARKDEAEAQKKAAAEAEKYARELERIAEEERRGAIEANKRWAQEQAAVEKVNEAIKKHISDLQVGVFGTSKQAATDAAFEFDLLQKAIARAGQSVATLSEGELTRYEAQLVKLEQLTRADAKANDQVATALGAVRDRLREVGAEGQLEGPRAKTEEVKDETVKWAEQLQNVSQLIQSFPGGLGKVGQALAGLAAASASIGTSFGKGGVFEKGIGAAFKGGIGKALQGATGLLGIASGAVGIGKAIVGLFKKDPVKQAQKEAGKILGKGISKELAEQLLASSKELGISVTEAAKRFKAEQEAALRAEKKQQAREGVDRATEGANQLAAGLEAATPAVARSAAEVFSAAFWAKVRQDGPGAAAEAFGPAFDELTKQLKAKGVDTAFLAPIAQQIGLGKDAKFAGVGTVAAGAANVLGGLRQAGLVDTALLASTGKLAQDLFTQAQEAAGAKGLGPEEAARAGFQAIAGLLEEQINSSLASGKELDANVQKLIDEAKANGIEILADPAIQSLAVQKDQLSVLRSINSGIGGIQSGPPAGAISAATGIVGFTGRRSPLIQTHPGEFVAVISAPQLRSLSASAAAASKSASGAVDVGSLSISLGDVVVNVDASGATAPEAIGEAAAEALRQELASFTAQIDERVRRIVDGNQ